MIFSCKLAYVEPLCTNSYVDLHFCSTTPKSAPLRVLTLRLLVCLDGAISTQILLGSHTTHHKDQFTWWKHSTNSNILLDISHYHQLVPQYLNSSYLLNPPVSDLRSPSYPALLRPKWRRSFHPRATTLIDNDRFKEIIPWLSNIFVFSYCIF